MGSNRSMNLNGYWTDEKHVQFLNSMEASFVRAMFQSNSHPLPRLDRYLPDTSDSTLDLNTRTTRRIPTTGIHTFHLRLQVDRPPHNTNYIYSTWPVYSLSQKAGFSTEFNISWHCLSCYLIVQRSVAGAY